MSRSTARALGAFESALRHAPEPGLRDLHEALQTGQLAVQCYGKADLIRGGWGTLGRGEIVERYSACPLNALYIRWAATHGRGLDLALHALTRVMAPDGYRPAEFYEAWDRGQLSRAELLVRVERALEARLNGAHAAE